MTLVTAVKLAFIIGIINISCFAWLILLKFQLWDVAATVISLVFSVCVVYIKRSEIYQDAVSACFRNFLVMCIFMGGTSAFFWFFHVISNVAQCPDDILGTIWNSGSAIMSFLMSTYLVMVSHEAYFYALLPEKSRLIDVSPLVVTHLAENCLKLQYEKKFLQNINPV